jgi:hypothetical protein
VGMHSPHAVGLASQPFAVTPQYVPSPEVEVSPPSDESCCLGDNHPPSGLMKQNSGLRRSPGQDVLVSQLITKLCSLLLYWSLRVGG